MEILFPAHGETDDNGGAASVPRMASRLLTRCLLAGPLCTHSSWPSAGPPPTAINRQPAPPRRPATPLPRPPRRNPRPAHVAPSGLCHQRGHLVSGGRARVLAEARRRLRPPVGAACPRRPCQDLRGMAAALHALAHPPEDHGNRAVRAAPPRRAPASMPREGGGARGPRPEAGGRRHAGGRRPRRVHHVPESPLAHHLLLRPDEPRQPRRVEGVPRSGDGCTRCSMRRSTGGCASAMPAVSPGRMTSSTCCLTPTEGASPRQGSAATRSGHSSRR
ncbi:hypothetical protein BS78_03G075600 [Paspalum vaginatum]|nr:hypothetical protein BS78_03G075600 [Paspalum vaginatum]